MVGGTFYKGSARQTQDVLWLVWHGVQEIIAGNGVLELEMASLGSAVQLARQLRKLAHERFWALLRMFCVSVPNDSGFGCFDEAA